MFINWQLKKKRIKYQKKLNDNNLCLYKSITFYINNSNLRTIEKEEILNQILDMMLQGQMDNRPMSMIIGDDYEEFCKAIIEEYKMSRNMPYNILIYLQQYLFWVVITSSIILVTNILINNHIIGITLNDLIMSSVYLYLLFLLQERKDKKQLIF